jgi:exodeoxyribonuclease VII large subunit
MTARLLAARRQIERALHDGGARIAECEVRGRGAVLRALSERRQAVGVQGKLLEASSYERVLDRGFVLVEDLESGAPVTAAADLPAGETVTLHFHDGRVEALIAESAALRRVRRSRAQVDPTKQGSLL